ncbi:MAG: DEAD/DEAH box helicase, partial [Gammaproteobacteria bacterium]
MSFENLGLVPELVRAVATQGYTEPTPIQAQAIPHVLTGGDLMAGAQTGTGKTAAFALPMLQRLSERNGPMMRLPRALVLVPTRELAAQVHASFRTYGRHMALRTVEIFGGVGMPGQVRALRAGVDIVVATPGRLLDHVKQRTVDLSAIEILVLDEADRMLDMGFLPDVERILKLLGGERQTLLFSATFPDPIRKLAQRFQRSPALIEVARRNAPAAAVEQIAYRVDSGRKRELLSHLIWEKKWAQVLVFTRTKHGADRLAKQLGADKIDTAVIHGNKSQSQRIRALHDFKKQSVRVLVATDIAARGIDIDELPNVVNYELPHVPEDYVHRIGRTGRAGNAGTAVSLVCAEERGQFDAIRRLVGVEIATLVEPGFEPLHGDAPGKAPQQRQGNPGNRQGRNGGQGQPRRNAGRGNDERRPQRQDAPRADERQPQRNDNRSFDSRQPGRNDNRRFDSRQPGRNDNRRFDGRQPGRNANSGFDARQPERNDNRSFDARQPERNDNRSFDARQPERNDNRSF